MDTRYRNSEAGIALIAVLLILALLMGLAAGFTTSITMDTGLRGAFQRSTAGFYAAESGLNKGMGETRNVFLSLNKPTGPWGNRASFTVGSRTVTYNLNPSNPGPDGNGVGQQITIPAGQLFAGLSSTEYNYTENAWAVSPAGDTEANVSADFNVGNIPLFQFIAFYAGDLEILPGPNMTLNGRIHTNGDLYLNTNTGSTLSIADNPNAGIYSVQVSAKGDIYRGRKDTTQPSPCTGTVSVDMLQDIVAPSGDLDPQTLPCQNGAGSIWKVPAATLQTWKGSMISRIQSITIPQPDIIKRGTGDFWNLADLRIVLKLNANAAAAAIQGPPFVPVVLPHVVEAQNKDGSRNAAQTTALQNFMNDAVWNQTAGNSLFPNTRPIFYTDVPNSATNTCTDTNRVNCNNATAASYTPKFIGTLQNLGNNANNDNRVYASDMRTANVAGSAFDADYRRGGFYNWRERKWMLLFNINVGDLLRWNKAQPAAGRLFDPADISEGGPIIFASIDDSNLGAYAISGTINNYGVRVFGTRNLPNYAPTSDLTGLTFVTDQALYILGDYNRAANGDSAWEPAALMGDSINVMSNNYWQTAGQCAFNSACARNDRQSIWDVTHADRGATDTTINAAFLAGVDVTNGALYNGGLENYPRFHEDWGGDTLTYNGSFVSLGTPVHVNGLWCGTGGDPATNNPNNGGGVGCNIYNAPTRTWNYDSHFNNFGNLPPNTPVFVYVQQVLFTESFQ